MQQANFAIPGMPPIKLKSLDWGKGKGPLKALVTNNKSAVTEALGKTVADEIKSAGKPVAEIKEAVLASARENAVSRHDDDMQRRKPTTPPAKKRRRMMGHALALVDTPALQQLQDAEARNSFYLICMSTYSFFIIFIVDLLLLFNIQQIYT